MSNDVLQPIEQAHLPAVHAVMADAFDPRFGEAWSIAQLSSGLMMPHTHGAVLSAGGLDMSHPAKAFVIYRTLMGESEMLLLAVARSHQGRGHGRALISHWMSEARKQGATRFLLEVRKSNRALELYEKMGFKVIGRRPDYYRGDNGTRHDALTMSISLEMFQKSDH